MLEHRPLLEEVLAAAQQVLTRLSTSTAPGLPEKRLRIALAGLGQALNTPVLPPTPTPIPVPQEPTPLLIPVPILPGGNCACGKRAVVRYVGANIKGAFDWPRCGTCPGARTNWGMALRAIPMERHHRELLAYTQDEAIFLERARNGIVPPALGDQGCADLGFDGHVVIEVYLWRK